MDVILIEPVPGTDRFSRRFRTGVKPVQLHPVSVRHREYLLHLVVQIGGAIGAIFVRLWRRQRVRFNKELEVEKSLIIVKTTKRDDKQQVHFIYMHLYIVVVLI